MLFCHYIVFSLQFTRYVSIVFYIKQNQTTLLIMEQYFLTIYFIAFEYIVVSDLNSNPNDLIEVLSFRYNMNDNPKNNIIMMTNICIEIFQNCYSFYLIFTDIKMLFFLIIVHIICITIVLKKWF